MGSRAHHPYLKRVIDHLRRYGHTWILPYLTVMLSTGPLFLSVMWKEYLWTHPKGEDEINVLMPDWYYPSDYNPEVNGRFEEDNTRFFSSFGGSSWHRSDVAFIFWVPSPPPLTHIALALANSSPGLQAEKHWLLLTFLITTGVLSLFAVVYFCTRSLSAFLSYRRFRSNAWARLRKSNPSDDDGIWSSSSPSDRESSDQNWIEMEMTEIGAQSPHFE